MPKAKSLEAGEREQLIETLKGRFEANAERHAGIDWAKVAARLEGAGAKLAALFAMEATRRRAGRHRPRQQDGRGRVLRLLEGEPEGRRSVCYDREALAKREGEQAEGQRGRDGGGDGRRAPGRSAVPGAAGARRVRHHDLELDPDATGRSGIAGGALFCDRRYGQVFTYHNGADSYYAARGFRGTLRV